ncbi:MAG: hypothetical protein ABI162_00420 [Luteolibacter sp.]
MKEEYIKLVEFIGGPEDGRLLDSSFLDCFEFEMDAQEHGSIPLMLNMDGQQEFEAGDEVEVQLLGVYVAKKVEGGRLKFEWIAKPGV